MVRTDKEIDELVANGNPDDLRDAFDAYEDRIRALEIEIAEMRRGVGNLNNAAMVAGLDMIHNALHNKGVKNEG